MRFGKKHLELALFWMPTAVTYGTTGVLTALYITDWQLVLQHVPFYGGKFKDEE